MISKLIKSHQIFLSLITLIILSLSSILVSQEINGGNKQKTKKPARELYMKDYWPILQEDPRIKITGLNVDRRYAKNGSGEFMDISFSLKNRTNDNINLIGFVMAYYETNAVDNEARAMIPYPLWRKRDMAKERFIVDYMRVSPNQITAPQIWDYTDPDFFKQNQILAKRRNSILGNQRTVSDTLPPIWKYIEFAKYNADQGLPFILYGDKGPTEDKQLITNYVDATPEEEKTKIFKNLEKHTYTIEYNRRETMFRTIHFTKFRAKYRFFNRFAIILLDAKRVAIFDEQKNRKLNPGEERIEPIVTQRIVTIPKPPKNL